MDEVNPQFERYGNDNSLQRMYRDLVKTRKKPGHSINVDPNIMDLLHMAVGVASEAGELVDVIKKHAVYGQRLDVDHLVEELGDLEFYLEGVRQATKVPRELVLSANITKLKARYQNEYSDEEAALRRDK